MSQPPFYLHIHRKLQIQYLRSMDTLCLHLSIPETVVQYLAHHFQKYPCIISGPLHGKRDTLLLPCHLNSWLELVACFP
nr:hypothetical protein Iba_chr05fCG7170 [Ipomoea batatas]GMD93428.1 hypothetical protein Iba_chr14fCG7350 [Ipomoea batatas]